MRRVADEQEIAELRSKRRKPEMDEVYLICESGRKQALDGVRQVHLWRRSRETSKN